MPRDSQRGGLDRPVDDGDRVEAGRVGVEIARPHQAVAVAAVQQQPRQRRAVALVDQFRDAAAGGEVNVVGQRDDRRPNLGRIDAAGRPNRRGSAAGPAGRIARQRNSGPRGPVCGGCRMSPERTRNSASSASDRIEHPGRPPCRPPR